jgi:DNA adenine methylase
VYDQLPLFELEVLPPKVPAVQPFKTQLLKWVGNKQRFAHEIIAFFPEHFGTYHEPFLGSGAVLGTLAPSQGVASDALKPLIDLWQTLQIDPETVKSWYNERWQATQNGEKVAAYERIKAAYNRIPNAADLLFIARACYGGVVRFRKDGYISTPCGIHDPVNPVSFAQRVDLWHERIALTRFIHSDFEPVMQAAKAGDLIYCDPPYVDTQAILYGAQNFSLKRLFDVIAKCKARGVYVALSLDGSKKSGKRPLSMGIPDGLFAREVYVNCGRSMLRRFQMEGQTLEAEVVTDRLLLTY